MREDANKKGTNVFAVNAVLGSIVGLIVCLVLVAIFSIVIASGKISSGMMNIIAIAAFFVGSVIGAAWAMKKQKSKALLTGVAEGVILFLITIVVGAFMPGATLIGAATAPMAIAAIAGGVVSSFLLARRKKVKV